MHATRIQVTKARPDGLVGCLRPRPGLRVGVLPFVNVNGAPRVDARSTEITTRVVAALGTVRHVTATILSLPPSIGGRSVHLQEIGRRLDVNAVLLGNFRDTDRLREIAVELVDTTTGERPLCDRFYQRRDIGSRAAEEIAQAVAHIVARRSSDSGHSVSGA